MTALEKLDARWQAGGRICVGLDSRRDLLPMLFEEGGSYTAMHAFNKHLVDYTADLALAYKLNAAPYFREGIDGIRALIDTFTYIARKAPDVPTILDMKPGDALAEINDDYAQFAFEKCGADALTAQVYAGGDAAEGFTKYKEKLIFFLCKTSNKGSGEFQDVEVKRGDVQFAHNGQPVLLHQDVATSVMMHWNRHGNCGLVVGATYPEQLHKIRSLAADMPILAPGIGKQAGEFGKTILAGIIPNKGRLIINESRSIIFAPYDKHEERDDHMIFAKAARRRLEARTEEYNNILATGIA